MEILLKVGWLGTCCAAGCCCSPSTVKMPKHPETGVKPHQPAPESQLVPFFLVIKSFLKRQHGNLLQS